MPTATSPAKFILFGEHAVVYGEPAIAVAIRLPLKVMVKAWDGDGKEHTIDGERPSPRAHSYIIKAIEANWEGGPLDVAIESEIPRASGLGSSAAVTVATVAAVRRLAGLSLEEEAVARSAFEVEYEVQGRASPTDTSTITHGNAVMLARKEGKGLLWKVTKGEKTWFVHHLDMPDTTFVIGNTRMKGKTRDMVAKVRRYYDKSGYARETIEEMGQIALDGAKALARGDLAEVGRLMDLNHKRLSSLGVSSRKLDKLVKAVEQYSFGAKLTGAGGGGCMVALTDRPRKAADAIKRAGGTPIIVAVSKKGVVVTDR